MQPRRAGNIWSNEDAQLAQKGSRAAATAASPAQAKGKALEKAEAAEAPGNPRTSEHPGRSAWKAELRQTSGEHAIPCYMPATDLIAHYVPSTAKVDM